MQTQIQINQLLMEREDRLVEVFELERQIGIILGGASYPLDVPLDLPSRQTRKSKSRKTAAVEKAPPPFRLRKLDPDTESAYRICYLENGEGKAEIHLDPRPLALLLNTPLPRIGILRIETVHSADATHWTPVETLFEAPGQE